MLEKSSNPNNISFGILNNLKSAQTYCISSDYILYLGPFCIKQLDFDVCVKLNSIPIIQLLYYVMNSIS